MKSNSNFYHGTWYRKIIHTQRKVVACFVTFHGHPWPIGLSFDVLSDNALLKV